MYATTCHRLAPVIMMVLAEALPDRVAAPQSSSGGAVSFNGREPGRRTALLAVRDPVGRLRRAAHQGRRQRLRRRHQQRHEHAGGGAGERVPGADAVLRDQSRFRRRGKYRGGLGIRRGWQVLNDDVTLNLRLDRFKFSSPGLFGARPSAPAAAPSIRAPAAARTLHSKTANIPMSRGDTLLLELGGGGGWGDPLTREPERVLDDVRNGYVSVAAAREVYGVVIDPEAMTIDSAATRRQRVGAGFKPARATDTTQKTGE